MRSLRFLLLFLAVTAFALSGYGQQTPRKSYTMRGKVTDVDSGTKRISVANEAIPGGMAAMTMTYRPDGDQLPPGIHVGDNIIATIYDGDMTLYNLQVAPAAEAAPERGTKRGITLEDLETMALERNPALAQAEANTTIATGHARQAGLYPNPTVGYNGDEIRGGFSRGGKQGGYVSQTIVTAGKLGAARRVADLVTAQTATGAGLQRLRVLNNVRSAFYRVLADQRLVEVKQKLTILAADAVRTAYQLANIGQADRPDVLQAEVERQQIDLSLRMAENTLRASWRNLASVVGNSGLPQTVLEGDLEAIPDLNYDEWLERTLAGSPEVKLAEQSMATAEAALVLAKKVPIPDLQVQATLLQNRAPLIDSAPFATGVQAGAQIGVQLPIFNRNQGNTAAAKGEIESARQELVRLRLRLSRETANSFRDYESARITVRQYKTEMLPRAEQAFQLYQRNYRNMAAAYPQALIAQRTLFQLEIDYVMALEAAWQSALTIQGFGQMDGLSMPAMPYGQGPGR